MKASKSISLDQYSILDDAYKYFNSKLFQNTLPECMIVLHRRRNSRGYFHAERYIEKVNEANKKKKSKDFSSYDELAMNPDDFNRPDISILSTLVHEMAHVWRHRVAEAKKSRGGYHDKVWANKMEEIGLMPSTTGREGGKRTGQRVTHYIIEHGKFEKLCLKFLQGRSIKLSSFPISAASAGQSNKNKIKYSCSCGNNIWGKPGLSVQCVECEDIFMEE